MATKKTSSQIPRTTGATSGSKTKTKSTQQLVSAPSESPISQFLNSLGGQTQADCVQLDVWMREATDAAGVMYGKSIVGYGTTTIRYADGREAPWFKLGFSPRKQALTLYGVGEHASALLAKLGKHTTGKHCLYIKSLQDVDTVVLRELLAASARS